MDFRNFKVVANLFSAKSKVKFLKEMSITTLILWLHFRGLMLVLRNLKRSPKIVCKKFKYKTLLILKKFYQNPLKQVFM